MEKTDVLIIGGSASGIVTALTGKSNYFEKKLALSGSSMLTLQ